jgi:hypothetical protein
MTIQIHPEAAKRFNELADQLLTKIVPKPEPVRSEKAFRPDVHPVAHITEQDIIGPIEVKNSVFETAGKEFGRFFQDQDRSLGLIGTSFESFSETAGRLQATTDLRETTTHEIKDFEIWFPVHRTYLESSFSMGPIAFRTITRELLEEREARRPKPDPETALAFEIAFARERSHTRLCGGRGEYPCRTKQGNCDWA